MKGLCRDTSVAIKLLVDEDPSDAAFRVTRDPCRFIAPAFLRAEVGTALRKKERQGWSEPLANDVGPFP